MTKPLEFTKRMRAVYDALAVPGTFLLLTYGEREDAWTLEPEGQHVSPVTAQRLIARADIVAADDGLFDCAQTWRRVAEPGLASPGTILAQHFAPEPAQS